MLLPLDSSLIDTLAGLPTHPLVVHFAVVLLPLAALGLIALVAVPDWADRYGWLTLGALAVGTVAAVVAKESGEALARRVGTPMTHASWGDRLPVLAIALLLVAGGWFLVHRRARREGARRTTGTVALGVVAATLALVVTGVTVLVGHTGAQAAWGDVVTDSAPATTDPSADEASGTTTSSTQPTSGVAGVFSLADVAGHADATSCWTVIGKNVYDVTTWISRHPGGEDAILGLCGTDGTAAFDGQHDGEARPAAELEQFLIGTLG